MEVASKVTSTFIKPWIRLRNHIAQISNISRIQNNSSTSSSNRHEGGKSRTGLASTIITVGVLKIAKSNIAVVAVARTVATTIVVAVLVNSHNAAAHTQITLAITTTIIAKTKTKHQNKTMIPQNNSKMTL